MTVLGVMGLKDSVAVSQKDPEIYVPTVDQPVYLALLHVVELQSGPHRL